MSMVDASPHNKHIYTYLPLDLDVSEFQLSKFADEVESVSKEYWFWSPYRSCWMLPLYTGGGASERFQISDHKQGFNWTRVAESTPLLRSFLLEQVFSWMNPPGRTVILKTPPNKSISLHTDCSYEDRDKTQYKFRTVLRGLRNNLWFLGDKGEKYFVDGKHSSYLIDGSHPHGMDNEGPIDKLTLCVGAPWSGVATSQLQDLIDASLQKNKTSLILRDGIGRPESRDFFQNDYA